MPQTQNWSSSLEKFTTDSFGVAKSVSVGWAGGVPNSQVSKILVGSLVLCLVQL